MTKSVAGKYLRQGKGVLLPTGELFFKKSAKFAYFFLKIGQLA